MNPTLGIFIVILLITLGITYWAARRTSTTADFYAADSQLTAAQNGFALAGDWCSAAAFLGFTGLTALYGMDGAFYALGPLVAFCTVLFLIAEPMRKATEDILEKIRYLNQVAISMRAGLLDSEGAAAEIELTERQLHEIVEKLKVFAGIEG